MEHIVEKQYQCHICAEAFKTEDELLLHNGKHTSGTLYQCKHCEKILSQEEHLTNHMKIHTGENQYQCTLCDMVFSEEHIFTEHSKTHAGEMPNLCKLCDKAFAIKNELIEHMKIHTQGDSCHQCPYCDKTFSNISNLKSHIGTHTKENTYYCNQCNKAFITNSKLIDHMRVHTENRSFHCHHCDKNFSDYMYLKRHFHNAHMRILPGKNIYQCKECDLSFSEISLITEHLITHNDNKKYQCKHCNMAFYRITDCHKHMMNHTGEKLHLQCRHCDKNFSQDTAFKIHMKTHIAPQTYQCFNCGKSSSSLSGVSYLQTHNVNQPYMCRKCEMVLFNTKTIVQSPIHHQTLAFKGLKLDNEPGENLCYINATVNAMLNCQSVMNLVTSDLHFQVIDKLRFLVKSKQTYGCTESIREFLITNNLNQFKHKSQMDPDEFLRFLIPLSDPLANICTIYGQQTMTCDVCSIVSKTSTTHIGLHLTLSNRDNTIKNIIENNMDSSFAATCSNCNKHTNICKESFIYLPDIFFCNCTKIYKTGSHI